ncbi:carboxypeptidase regulatory-like domain-containing protein [candidate division KSB1 bacterium]|nr:carboxypeptidase regulatory-like domain-containing protein [candidate division KSB1 bacterium]NIR71553.1 carboxypeptidase regulatory-like domain-containing protein [candidate division KSB1 bacterium]NIS26349.1 carboxypeptidase regulatory-like domain-containing protein [candidate division KSB1 bacterium]NIT73116.1 carboxypeptidase regulatory-like domain-containing protein [candidate division KSB1 bacterium]NIU27032.1 carboxypeptidase regulatory-like domain-containing protein [candidate divisi
MFSTKKKHRRAVPAGKVVLLFCLCSPGCLDSPERSNPIDPNSDNFENVGRISGTTLSFYQPFTAIADVEVRLEPGSIVTQTDQNGDFFFDKIPVGEYQIAASKKGFAAVPDTLKVELGQTTNIQLNLDGLPLISSFVVNSGHISRWWPQTDLFLLEVRTQLDDPDGLNDIEMVKLEIPEMGFADTLQALQSRGTYTKTIRESSLPEKNLQRVLGREIRLQVQDRVGFGTRSEPKFLVRIIDSVPDFESPIGDTLVTANPVLRWKAISLPFDFTFRVEVVRVDFEISNLVWSSSGLPPSTTSVTVPDALPSGTYFWTVAAVDDFGNCSRSKEASFTIEIN